MKRVTRRFSAFVCALALVANSFAGAMAQERKNEYKTDANNVLVGGSLTESVTVTATDPNGPIRAIGLGDTNILQFFAQEMSFDSRFFSGAPFSAAIFSETVQTLADGTRIVQRAEGRMYRDTQGRTRNERSFALNETNAPKQVITIYDTVRGATYTLDPETHTGRKTDFFGRVVPAKPAAATATANITTPTNENAKAPANDSQTGGLTIGSPLKKIQPPYPATAKAARAAGLVKVETIIGESGKIVEANAISGHPLLQTAALEAARGWEFKPSALAGKPVKVRAVLQFDFKLVQEDPDASLAAKENPKYTAKTEKLGKQMIEGVECEGERKITTLLTGAIGNDRPIETVTETWYAPELRMIILSKRSDPRFGKSTYRVTHLVLAEPDAALFQPSSDYNVLEPPTPVKKKK